jgi:hypothetical protein
MCSVVRLLGLFVEALKLMLPFCAPVKGHLQQCAQRRLQTCQLLPPAAAALRSGLPCIAEPIRAVVLRLVFVGGLVQPIRSFCSSEILVGCRNLVNVLSGPMFLVAGFSLLLGALVLNLNTASLPEIGFMLHCAFDYSLGCHS